MMYAGATPPTGWLACDGAAVSRSTYAALFALIGTTYGAGDGSTTFNLPNLYGRFPLGGTALGQLGGAASHTHGITDHYHGNTGGPSDLRTNIPGGGGANAGSATHTHGTTWSTPSATSTYDGSTMPPYITLAFMIRT
jgi:microcystin-dependent protein